MKQRKVLTLIEVVVVIVVALLLVGMFVFWADHTKRRSYRGAYCGTNLKGLGTAMVVYAHDFDGNFPELPGEGRWSKELGFAFDLPDPDFRPGGLQSQTSRSITASWYLLVRYADVSPKSFVCPLSTSTLFGRDLAYTDITGLWDFGPNPWNHVSYALHNPYGHYPVDADTGANLAVAADMSPWFRDGDIVGPGRNGAYPQIITAADKSTWKLSNSHNHPLLKKRKLFGYKRLDGPSEGQYVVYADGHNRFEKSANCGLNKDNIYTFWSNEDNPADQDIQGGKNPTARDKENDARSKDDSFLAI